MGFLEHRLTSSRRRCVWLYGGAGSGKTWLARALCASLQRQYAGRTCLIEVPAEDVDQQALVADALRQLRLTDGTITAPEQVRCDKWRCSAVASSMRAEEMGCAQVLCDYLAATPVLMVLDNVSEAATAALQPFLSGRAPDSLVLATARDLAAITAVSRKLALEFPGAPAFIGEPVSMDEPGLRWQLHLDGAKGNAASQAVRSPSAPALSGAAASLSPAPVPGGALLAFAQRYQAGLAAMSVFSLCVWLSVLCCGCVALGFGIAGWNDANKWARVALCAAGAAGVLGPVWTMHEAGKAGRLEARVQALERRNTPSYASSLEQAVVTQ